MVPLSIHKVAELSVVRVEPLLCLRVRFWRRSVTHALKDLGNFGLIRSQACHFSEIEDSNVTKIARMRSYRLVRKNVLELEKVESVNK